ncbi:ATP-binding protein [Noviherbaspirillum galbum]|uniref:ATP-binding protein n=1 Tax=Noviherbaspirillum galbum TaxID=2709383 RepID=A0A6B3ST34_9BURK|nr:ATP-binding protein [Noviherbaspirillum galbum]NEX63927.1 ATP-binding protein [Noviherbaspirillum galbum]
MTTNSPSDDELDGDEPVRDLLIDPPGDAILPSGGMRGLAHRRVRFHVPAALEDISAVAVSVRAFIAGNVAEELCNAIELGVTEALTNVVTHGYAGVAHAAVEVTVEESPAAVVVQVIDSGRPIPEEAFRRAGQDVFDFDPDDIDRLPVGGMGLSLIKELFDAVRYESQDGINRLTLAKRIGATPSATTESDF